MGEIGAEFSVLAGFGLAAQNPLIFANYVQHFRSQSIEAIFICVEIENKSIMDVCKIIEQFFIFLDHPAEYGLVFLHSYYSTQNLWKMQQWYNSEMGIDTREKFL